MNDIEDGEVTGTSDIAITSSCTGINHNTHTPHTPTPTTSHTPAVHEACTRAAFPPYPRSRVTSSVSFAVVVNRPLSVNARISSLSAGLAHMYRTLTDFPAPSLSARASSLQTSITQIIPRDDIARIHVTPSRRNPQQHMMYITCSTPEASIRVKSAISQFTSLTPTDVPYHTIVGKVMSIPFRAPTSDILNHIAQHAPDITSLVITRIQHPRPSEHYSEAAYFSIHADEIRYLASIPPLPSQHTPMAWMRFTPPVVQMCTKCFVRGHTRSNCQHRDSPNIWCANCASPGHTARSCTSDKLCRCCGSTQHGTISCAQYHGTYTPMRNTIPTVLPLSPASHRSISPAMSHDSYNSMRSYMSALCANTVDTHTGTSLRPATRSPSSPHGMSPLNVRIDSGAIQSHDTRGNRNEPISPVMQQHMQRSPSISRPSTPHSPSSRTDNDDTTVRLMRLEQQMQDILSLLRNRTPTPVSTPATTSQSGPATHSHTPTASSAADANTHTREKRRRTHDPPPTRQ